MGLIITDLDNTLYDWVTYFARSFSAMVDELARLLNQERSEPIDREVLLDEFKVIHQKYRNSEHPFAVLELPSVRTTFGTRSRSVLARKLDPCLHAFNKERKRTLTLYEGVVETLSSLVRRGHVIVGHTEAVMVNSLYRLLRLGIRESFTRLYTLEGAPTEHPDPDRPKRLTIPDDFVREVPASERKPNRDLLIDICRREGFAPTDAVYVGDSLSRDVSMARQAGVHAIWARYGTQYDRSLWNVLVRITHWTPEDVERDQLLRRRFSEVEPDHIIDSFRELLPLVEMVLGEENASETQWVEPRAAYSTGGAKS